MSQQYWFPTMHNADIVAALDDWGLQSTIEQLVRPTPDFVYGIYTACLAKVTGITPESLREPSQNAVDAVQTDNQELYLGPIAHVILLQHL